MKTFTAIFLDKQGNELQRKNIIANSLKQAQSQTRNCLAVSMINDLHKIKII